MAYIGVSPESNFQTAPAVVRFSGDGSDTTFDLGRTIGSVQDILVSVDGVIQDTAAYTVPDGSTLTFSAAPSSNSGNNIFVYLPIDIHFFEGNEITSNPILLRSLSIREP